jgi:hypothetical protein
MKKITFSLVLILLSAMNIKSNIDYSMYPKLSKSNYNQKDYGYKDQMYLPDDFHGDYHNQNKFLSPLMNYYKNKMSSHHGNFPMDSYHNNGQYGNQYGNNKYGNNKYGNQYGNNQYADQGSYKYGNNKYGNNDYSLHLMPQKKYWGSVSKYMNSWDSYIKKMSHGNKYAMKMYNKYHNNCPYDSYKRSMKCKKYNYCCYHNKSKYDSYYMYKMYSYAKEKYGCKKAKMYTTRMGYKMLGKSAYWYKKYMWKIIPKIVYSYHC